MPNASVTCKAKDCKQLATGGRGYCRRHHAQWKRGGMPKARYKTCRVEGCRKKTAARGRCEEHFARDFPGKRAPAAAPPAEPAAT